MRKILLISALVISLGMMAQDKVKTVHVLGDNAMAQVVTEMTEGLTMDNRCEDSNCTSLILRNGWDDLVTHFLKGEVVLIHLGWNDMDETSDCYASIAEFEDNLEKMVTDIQAQKAIPVLCTPMAIPYFHDGLYVMRLGAYPEAVRRVAKKTHCFLLDMELETSAWWGRLSEHEADTYHQGETLTPAGQHEVAQIGRHILMRDKKLRKKLQ